VIGSEVDELPFHPPVEETKRSGGKEMNGSGPSFDGCSF